MALGATAAPGDVMRVLAHDIRQPLSTIESIAYYLTLILPQDEKVHEQLDRIQQLVEQSNWMVTSGLLLSDTLSVPHESVDLRELMQHIDVAGFDVEICDTPHVHVDPPLLRAMIENLVTLFRQFPGRPSLRIRNEGEIDFCSSAIGHRSESSFCPGSTLSIQGVRRVAESHGGSLHVSIHPETGIKLRVMLT